MAAVEIREAGISSCSTGRALERLNNFSTVNRKDAVPTFARVRMIFAGLVSRVPRAPR
jgi:hypothetical protein